MTDRTDKQYLNSLSQPVIQSISQESLTLPAGNKSQTRLRRSLITTDL